MASLREGSPGYGLVRSQVQQIDGTIAVRSNPVLAVTISLAAWPTGKQQLKISLSDRHYPW
jgi:hypothetical protein